MNNIKIPFSIKFNILLNLIFSTIFLIIVVNFFTYIPILLSIFLLIIYLLIFVFSIFFIKNPEKYYYINIFIYLFFIFKIIRFIYFLITNSNNHEDLLVGFFTDDFHGFNGLFFDLLKIFPENIVRFLFDIVPYLLLIFILFYIFIFFRLLIFKISLIKNKDKYLTQNNQIKSITISYLIFIFFLVIFYFSYFNKPYEFKKIDDNYFQIGTQVESEKQKKYYNLFSSNNLVFSKDFENELNNLIILIDTKEIHEVTSISYKKSDEFNKGKYDNNKYKNINDVIFDKKNILKIELLYNNLNKIIKEYGDYNFKDDNIEYQDNNIIKFNKYFIYNSIYYFQKGNQDKGIEYLTTNYLVRYGIFNNSETIIGALKGLNTLELSLKEINYILDNYKLSNNNIQKLKNILNKNIESKKTIKRIFINEYNYYTNILPNIKNSLLYNKNETIELLKNIFYHIAEEKTESEDFLGYDDKLDKGMLSNYFKKNCIGIYLLTKENYVYTTQINKFNGITKIKDFITEKLNNYE